MGLSQPGGSGGFPPNVLYGECNTPPSGYGAHPEYDKWYDEDTNEITGSETAALAAIGLTYAAGVFTATEAGVWQVLFAFDPKVCPADQINVVELGTAMFQANDTVGWDDATFPVHGGYLFLRTLVYFNGPGGGNVFSASQVPTGTITDPESMGSATITITRVL